MSDHWQDEVKVHYADSTDVAYLEHQNRSDAQKVQDTILAEAEEAATMAKASVEKALEWLAVVKPATRSMLPTQVGQLIEEIRELKRLRQ